MLQRFIGKTGFIAVDINIGYYAINESDIVLMDTGYGGTETQTALDAILECDFNVVAILLTHCHTDHCGGVNLIRKAFPNVKVYAPDIERQFIENPDLMGLFVFPSASSDWFLTYRHQPTKVHKTYRGKHIVVEGVTFGLVDLSGHSPKMTGIVTPDNVLYAADAYVSIDYLHEAKVLYSYDLTRDLAVKQWLLGHIYSGVILSHGKPETNQTPSILSNLAYYEHFFDKICELLAEPQTLEDLLNHLIQLQGITLRPFSYLIAKGSLAGMLVHLQRVGRVEQVMDEGYLVYHAV